MGNKTIISLMLILLCINTKAQTPSMDAEQYDKALWMTTRFYGAQRMGNGVNWLTEGLTWDQSIDGGWIKNQKGHKDGYTSGKSFLKDSDGSYDLTGGWFDCGDHVLFGQTFYYATYMLLLGYSEFAEGYGDYYSADYEGYIKSGKFNWEDKQGIPNNIPDILDECKYATDFILKAVRDKNTFYYQKGHGQSDHKNWVTSVMMTSFLQSEGGEYDKPRAIGKATSKATSMASLAGAALAVMSRVYSPYDASYAAQCLAKAKVAYEFVTSHEMGNTGAYNGDEYGEKPKYQPDLTILCAELYRATGNKAYLDKCNEYTAQWINNYNHGWTICYNNTEDLGLYAYAALGPSQTYYSTAKSNLKALTDAYKGSGNMLNKTKTDWGDLRYMAAQCFTRALSCKLQESKGIDPYVLTSIEYIMGHNSGQQSYITGFGSKSPLYPHHRNYYRSDEGNVKNVKDNVSESYKYRQLGYLVGGVYDGTFNDDPDNYRNGEGGIDYNAGLVGALAYIRQAISANDKQVAKIEMLHIPSKTTYTVGEDIDLTGGEIKITYTDNSVEYKDITPAMISGFNSSKAEASQSIRVSYKEKTTSFQVAIEKKPSKLILATAPKTEYITGEAIDLAGGVLHLQYNDGSYDEVALSEATVTGFSSATTGTKTVSVTYKGMKTSYEVSILQPPVSEIVISPAPVKKVYQINESLDLSGGKIKVFFKGGDMQTINITPEMVTGFRSDKAGKYTLTVNYGTQHDQFEITVEKKPTKLSITQMPKTEYAKADLLDVSGGMLRYEYNDGTYDDIQLTADMVSGFLNSTEGERTLTVSYNELSTSYVIVITKAAITKIGLEPAPAQTTFKKGEPLNLGDTKIVIYYANNTQETINIEPGMVEGYAADSEGSQTITIRYLSHSTSFTVTVENPGEDNPEDPDGADPEPDDPTTPVESVPGAKINIYSHGHTIYVEGFDGLVEVFSLSGARVFSGSNIREISISSNGIYIVKAGMVVRKVGIN